MTPRSVWWMKEGRQIRADRDACGWRLGRTWGLDLTDAQSAELLAKGPFSTSEDVVDAVLSQLGQNRGA